MAERTSCMVCSARAVARRAPSVRISVTSAGFCSNFTRLTNASPDATLRMLAAQNPLPSITFASPRWRPSNSFCVCATSTRASSVIGEACSMSITLSEQNDSCRITHGRSARRISRMSSAVGGASQRAMMTLPDETMRRLWCSYETIGGGNDDERMLAET